MSVKDQKLPQFALIKQFLERQIKSGQWPAGTRIPTEQSLTQTFSVSRMTARRAVKELADRGLVSRTPGLGTFVAEPPKPLATVVVKDIVDHAKKAGTHSYRMLSVDAVPLTSDIANIMRLQTGTSVFRLMLLHLEANRAVQLQRLFVNCAIAPALLKQKLDKIDPNTYLEWHCAANHKDYRVTAVIPSASERRELGLSHDGTASCIQVSRRDCIGDEVISFTTLLHTAGDYYLGTNFEETK